MGGNCDRRQRAACEFVGCQPDRLGLGIVVVTLRRFFDRDFSEPVLVEQVPGELSTRSGIAIGGDTVTIKHASYPEPGAENNRDEDNNEHNDRHRSILARIGPVLHVTEWRHCGRLR